MKIFRSHMKKGLLVALGLLLVWVGYKGYRYLLIANGFAAKVMCSCHFVSGRSIAEIQAEELDMLAALSVKVDEKTTSVSSSLWGLARRKAIYRPGLGCTLMAGHTREELKAQAAGFAKPSHPNPDSLYWPMGNRDTLPWPQDVDSMRIQQALDRAFSEPDSDKVRRTRAVIILYQGKIVGERYAAGFDLHTPQSGWSMHKSLTQALTGILVKQGKLTLNSPAPVAAWADEKDPRHMITLDQLLRMSSGLTFDESYFSDSDANRMLFVLSDVAGFATNKALYAEPDSFWSYSSGTSNVISGIIRQQFSSDQAYWRFPYETLLHPAGMWEATLEPDASGTFVGSSYCYAPARDWAKLGLLYLQEGKWQGNQLLPPGWTDYASKRTLSDPAGQYGAHFWTNAKTAVPGPTRRYWPEVPEDAYYASGFEGQSVVIIPSREAVVVRMGQTLDRSAWDLGELVADLLAGLPE